MSFFTPVAVSSRARKRTADYGRRKKKALMHVYYHEAESAHVTIHTYTHRTFHSPKDRLTVHFSPLQMPICPFTDHEFYILSRYYGKVKIIMIIAAPFFFFFFSHMFVHVGYSHALRCIRAVMYRKVEIIHTPKGFRRNFRGTPRTKRYLIFFCIDGAISIELHKKRKKLYYLN